MKDQIKAAKYWYNRNADVVVYSIFGAAIALAGVFVGYDLGKRKTTDDLRVTGATSYTDAETGEDSPLYLTHHNGKISRLMPAHKK